MHHGAGTDLDDLTWEKRRWNGLVAYAESKLWLPLKTSSISGRVSGIPKHMTLANKMSGWIIVFVFPALVLTIFDAYSGALI
jgi:hypothetical protein